MSVLQIRIRALIHQQGADSFFRLAQTSGIHGSHRIIPSPGLTPVPVVPHPVQGILHVVVTNEFIHRKNTYRPQYSHVIAGKTNIFVCINSIFRSKVKMILIIGKRRKFINHLIPLQITLLSGTLAPLLRGLHGKVPVRQFERRVDGSSCTQRLLCRNSSLQNETSVKLIISCKSIHELGSFLHQTIVFLNHFIQRIGTVDKFCQQYVTERSRST